MQDEGRREQVAQEDALQASVDPDQAAQLVSFVTRFATIMCVIIAVVKVVLYQVTGSPAVKTSAMDSIGDLIANIITLYTGYRMATNDTRRYPAGQSRFEPIGIVVFATLMATMMFNNAMENFGDLMSEEETSREDAISTFWQGLFGVYEEVDEKNTWKNPDAGFQAFLGAIKDGAAAGLSDNVIMKKVLQAKDFAASQAAIQATVDLAAEVEDENMKWGKLLKQSLFLGCCAAYKCCLFCYVQFVAIPKTGSSVLQALANDKRNDFIATSFLICVTLFAKINEPWLEAIHKDLPEMADPGAALILACVIMYTWVGLLAEQVGLLSGETLEADILDPMAEEVNTAAKAQDPTLDTEVRAYYTSSKSWVEVDLIVSNPKMPFQDVSNAMGAVQQKVSTVEDVERVIVVPKYGI